MSTGASPLARLWDLVREEKSDVSAIYFFAMMAGFIQLSLPVGVQAIIGFVQGGRLSTSLIVLITILVAAVLCNGMLQLSQMRVIERIQQRIFVRYAFAFADRIPKLDLKKVDGYYLPELVNRFLETASLQKSLSKILLDFPAAIIQLVLGLILLSLYHPFFIVFGILLLLFVWLLLYYSGHKGLQTSLAESRHKYGVLAWLEEMARIVKTFKLSAGSGLHLKKADAETIQYLQARTEHFRVLAFQYKTLIFFKVAVTAGMLIAGVTLLLDQQINIGQFVAAEIIIITAINAVEKMIVNLDSVYDVLTAVEKVNKLVDKPTDRSGNFAMEHRRPPALEAAQLSFSYDDGRKILNDVTFTVRPGEKIAISGANGSGKSTLLRLVAGMYNDFSGTFCIDGVPVGNYKPESLYERTGALFSTDTVFHGTLWENLTMGREGIDKDFVHVLVNEAGLQSFLASLPYGYDTALDPTGDRLPGNVIRKILLVRALAHKPPLLVLEDPWQGINDESISRIRDRILSDEGITLLIASNDASVIERCNKIIALKP